MGNVAQNSRGLAGGLRSGLSTFGPRLSHHERVVSFRNHIASFTLPYLDRAHATALVSTSSRLIDTLKRAFDKVYDGENPESVYVVFIRVPQDHRPIVHSARELALQAGEYAADRFKYEFLFEYEIPRKYVHHAVTVATLMDRGLKLDGYLLWDERSDQRKLPGTASLTQDMAEVEFAMSDLWGSGLRMGFFVKAFGARAPLGWIEDQLFRDLFHVGSFSLEGASDGVRIRVADGGSTYLSMPNIAAIREGTDTSVVDWWLTSDEFMGSVEDYHHWREIMEDALLDRQTKAEAYETDGFEAIAAWQSELEETMEAEAVRIGL